MNHTISIPNCERITTKPHPIPNNAHELIDDVQCYQLAIILPFCIPHQSVDTCRIQVDSCMIPDPL